MMETSGRRFMVLAAAAVLVVVMLVFRQLASHGGAAAEAGAEETSVAGPAPVEDGEGEPTPAEVTLPEEAISHYGVVLGRVERRELKPTIKVTAHVDWNAEAVARLGSALKGRIVEILSVGTAVRKGDPLFTIESPELADAQSEYLQRHIATLTAAPAAALARNAFDRARDLFEKTKGIALTEVQRREVEFRAAEANLQAAIAAAAAAASRLTMLGMEQAAIDDVAKTNRVSARSTVRSPLDGRVIERDATLGELVGPETERVMVVADPNRLWVIADVPESQRGLVANGSQVRITARIPHEVTASGRVALLASVIDIDTRTAELRIEVSEGQTVLIPGMFVEAEIDQLADPTPTLVVPESAPQTIGSETIVFVPVAGRERTFEKRVVVFGPEVAGLMPIVSGLNDGEQVVISGSFILKADLLKSSAAGED